MSFDERAHFRLKTGRDSCPSARICPRLVTLTDSAGSALSNEKSEIRNQNRVLQARDQTNGGRFRALRTARRAVDDGRLCRRSPRNRTHTAPPTTSSVATAFPRRRQHHERA